MTPKDSSPQVPPGCRITWIRIELTQHVLWLEINGSRIGPGPGVWIGGKK